MKLKKKRKNKKKISKEDIYDISVSINREEQKKDGFFDGRYREKE